VGALHKDRHTGTVLYKDVCIGCRYCQIACPCVPKFEWDKAFPNPEMPALPHHPPGQLCGLGEFCPIAPLSWQCSGSRERSQTAAVFDHGADDRLPLTPGRFSRQNPAEGDALQLPYGAREGGGSGPHAASVLQQIGPAAVAANHRQPPGPSIIPHRGMIVPTSCWAALLPSLQKHHQPGFTLNGGRWLTKALN
jgi:hypothetical protein